MDENNTTTEPTFLVYGEGYPEEGQMLSQEALQAELESGRLTSGDLVWCDNVWRQISEIFELEPYRLPDYTDANEPEIALDFKKLPSCHLVPEVADSSAVKHSVFGWLIRGKDGRLRSVPILALEVLVVVIVLGFLGYYAILPGINRLYWRPAYVLVYNPYPTPVTVKFMDKEYKIAGNTHCTIPDIFGRMPRSEKMLLQLPKGKDGKEPDPKKINVPLSAAETVLVNPDGIISFGVMKLRAQGKGISDSEKNAIVEEIRSGKAPVTAIRVAENVKKDGREALLAYTNDKIIRSSDSIVKNGLLNLQQLGLTRSEDYLAHHTDMDATPMAQISRNLLRGVSIKDIKIFYRRGSNEVAECEFKLSFPKDAKSPFKPVRKFGKNVPTELRDFDELEGGAVCKVRFDEKQTIVEVKFEKNNFKVVRNQRTILGRWSYTASQAVNNKKWSWKWQFEGQDAGKVATLRLVMPDHGKIDKANIQYNERRPAPPPKTKK
ncbi:MAG: hypothetical protein J6X55_17320 [Victivallales bacterium]|nr:hypothetical protein [Victivallales bacterium]